MTTPRLPDGSLLKVDADRANAVRAASPLKASQVLRAAIKKRGGKVGSITFFYSAKNSRDIVFPNEVCFACGLLLEADESVKSYDFDPDRIREQLSEIGFDGSMPTVIVWRWNDRPLLQLVRRTGNALTLSKKEEARHSAELIGFDWKLFDEQSVEEQSRLMHDWIHVAPVLAQHGAEVSAQWHFLSQQVKDRCVKPTTLGALRDFGIAQWPLVFTTVFRLTQLSILTTDIDLNPLSAATVVKVR
ncbi:hypothetical protein [Acidovorax sp.]|uniref:hypothetical protein n=1 Tax=Acidovorax sp. TaxID=1872122 RepID=UPI0040376B5D